ncbi:MAG: hypothetical protein M3209_11595 [Acidobacteriota bacterium]|nr:hypothetical protein [Acidobacteriota bacterium]
MQNLQNIPGDTDIENPLPDDQAPSEEKGNNRRDYPLPTDKLPTAPVEEPNAGTPINENPREPQRIMSFFTASQRRIF